MIEVEFYGDEFGIIMRHETGIVYTVQAAGICCAHPSAEGFFVPIQKAQSNNRIPFYQEFHGDLCCLMPTATEFSGEPTVAEANAVNKTLQEYGYPFSVDMSALKELTEAWIPIVIDKKISHPFDVLAPCAGMRAILIYPNCD